MWRESYDIFMPPRLFAAIDLDDATRAFVQHAADLLAAAGVRGRFEQPSKFHLTLAFLGATAEERVGDVVAALRVACRLCVPFELALDTIGAFPDERRPRILWVGPQQSSDAFTRCADAVLAALTSAGWQLDRKPQPHVTVCRLKSALTVPLPRLAASASLPVSSVTLYESRPAGPTTRYVEVERMVFG